MHFFNKIMRVKQAHSTNGYKTNTRGDLMKNLARFSVIVLFTSLSLPALASNCQQVAEAAAIKELRQEFPTSGGHTSVDSISIQGTTAAVMLDNQDINDVSMEVDVPIQQIGGGNCKVTGEPVFVGGDNS